MLYRRFGKTGWLLSAIGMGTWNIGNQWGELDEATAWATVRAAFESGSTSMTPPSRTGSRTGYRRSAWAGRWPGSGTVSLW